MIMTKIFYILSLEYTSKPISHAEIGIWFLVIIAICGPRYSSSTKSSILELVKTTFLILNQESTTKCISYTETII